MHWCRKLFLFLLILIASLVATVLSNTLMEPRVMASEALLEPAPTQSLGYYDYFGKLLSKQQAANLVRQQGLDPNNPVSYQQIGAVQITQQLLDSGKNIFFNSKVGDTFGLQEVLGFSKGIANLQVELGAAIEKLNGQSTTNLPITLLKDITLGSHTLPQGTVIPTGLDVDQGGSFPVGLKPTGNITCAICHVSHSRTGDRLEGVPNGDLAISLLIALAPNTAAGFARLHFNPLDPQYQGNGKTIIDSQGNTVELPDPQKFESAFDDAVLNVPYGNFESSPDGINNTTQIPSLFTFKSGPYLADGQFAVGPFGGLSAVGNAVHSSEVNLLAAAQLSAQTTGIDSEVYLGTVLQNAANPLLRLPEGKVVKPSQWLRTVAPIANRAELEDQIPAPDTGSYPNLKPTLFTYNGLIFSPNTDKRTHDSGPFLFAANAMAAYQNSLLPPPNTSLENQQALSSGSVRRGAEIFEQANCATCHIPPFFTDNLIHPIKQVETNPARAESRLALNDLLVAPKIYTLDTPVPIPANAKILQVPTEDVSKSPTTLPTGILPDGGYKTSPLRGLYLSAPYLHDGGVAVRADALKIESDGSFTVVNQNALGLTGTLSIAQPADSASSLRALLDRNLRSLVIAANKANPALVSSNLDGTGHEFYVDRDAGFSASDQSDLINFLLSLDDNPGQS